MATKYSIVVAFESFDVHERKVLIQILRRPYQNASIPTNACVVCEIYIACDYHEKRDYQKRVTTGRIDRQADI